MLGFLLARSGVRVTVLEKHADFLRDFRGDTIHPSTLDVIAELGLLEEFLRLPHQQVTRLAAEVYGERIPLADFTHLPTRCKFIAMMPHGISWTSWPATRRHSPASHCCSSTR